MIPRMICGWTMESLSTTPPNLFSSSMIIPNTIVVAPDDQKSSQISTGLAVALKVLPALSPFSSWYLLFSKSASRKPKSRLIYSAARFCLSGLRAFNLAAR